MKSNKKIEILPYIWGYEISLDPGSDIDPPASAPSSDTNSFDKLKQLIDSQPSGESLFKKEQTAHKINNQLKVKNMKNNWRDRKIETKVDILPTKKLSSVQFEVPIITIHPQSESLETLQRLENIHQIITGDSGQRIYSKCKGYCVDGRTPPGKNLALPKSTIIYTADLFSRRKVLYKLWKYDDPRSYNILDIKHYSSLMDVSRGIIPGVLPAYVYYLKNKVYKQFDSLGLYGLNTSTLPATDQQLLKQIPGIFLCI